jgi:chromosome segregation ATPase
VSTVRAAAGVSNADATRYLKEWTEEKQAAGGQVAATPAALLEQAARLAGACWAEASALATGRHSAIEVVWAQERKEKDLEIAELVADLDKANAESDAAAAEHGKDMARLQAQSAALERQLAAIGKQLEDSRESERAAAKEAADAVRKLATAEVRATTLEQVHNALLRRVSPETKNAGG